MSQPVATERSTVLSVTGIHAGYGRTRVLFDVNMAVPPGSVVALIGANGAGKTTLLRVISGLLTPTRGTVAVDGTEVTKEPPHRRARRGVCLIPEGRGIFRSLTVKENLEVQRPPWIPADSVAAVFDAFPVLAERLHQVAGSLSGGQQQMLALARAFVAQARVILLDEVSMGLAPIIVEQIFQSLQALAQSTTSLVIVEQYVNRVLDMADLAYVMVKGRITWEGQASLLDRSTVMASYLGEEVGPGN